MAITQIASTKFGTGPTSGTSSAINTTGATLIVVSAGGLNIGTISDNKSNTYTALPIQNHAQGYFQFFYVLNPIVGSGHTFTFSGAATVYTAVIVQAFAGIQSFDKSIGNKADTVTTLNSGSIVPSTNGCLVITGLNLRNALTGALAHVSPSMTELEQVGVNAVNSYGITGYLIQVIAAPISATWTWTGSDNSATTIASFNPILDNPDLAFPTAQAGQKLNINLSVTIQGNTKYALPTKACKITTSLTLEQSNDGITWTTNPDQVFAGLFIRSTSGSGTVKCIPC